MFGLGLGLGLGLEAGSGLGLRLGPESGFGSGSRPGLGSCGWGQNQGAARARIGDRIGDWIEV